MTYLKIWKTLKSTMVINNQWCKVRQDIVELADGKIIDDYFVNIRPEIALVLPITNNQEIVLVRQYRHGVKKILLELPAGAFDSDLETAELAAIRELKEETGYISEKIISLGILYDNPVKDTNKIHLFIAQNATKAGEQELDHTEDIEVVLIPIKEVLEKVTSGEICVSGSVAAILLGFKKGYLEL